MSYHWAIPIVKVAVPWVWRKIFKRDERPAVQLMDNLSKIQQTYEEIDNMSGDEKREAVWSQLAGMVPEVQSMGKRDQRVLNDLVLSRIREQEDGAEEYVTEALEVQGLNIQVTELKNRIREINYTIDDIDEWLKEQRDQGMQHHAIPKRVTKWLFRLRRAIGAPDS